MEDKIQEAIALLRNNDYAVIKITAGMQKDYDECSEMNDKGKSKDCLGCSCNGCIVGS